VDPIALLFVFGVGFAVGYGVREWKSRKRRRRYTFQRETTDETPDVTFPSWERSMFRKLVIGALGAMAVLFSTTAFAQGTAADAKAMLERTVAAIKADKAKTLDQINKGENGFLVGDLYPFCFNLSDALLVAIGNPNVKGLLGKDARTFKDPTGDVYGPRLYDAAKEGQVNEVSYMSPKAGADKTWVPKASFVTAVAGLGCGVGYYK
jgi:hypothetical protein